jgi:WD40 repeat protein
VWSPDDNELLLLSEHGDRSVATVLDLKTGTLRRSLDARTSSRASQPRFISAEWSSEGLVALARAGGFVIWDPRSNEPIRVEESDSPENADRLLTLSANGALLATVPNASNEVRLWDPKTATRKGTLPVENWRIEAVAFSGDGTRIALAADSYSPLGQHADVLIYDTASSELVSTLHTADARSPFGAATSLHWTPQGRAIVSVDSNARIKLWNVASDDPPLDLLAGLAVGPAALADSGNLLLMGQTFLGVWDLRTRTRARMQSGDGSAIQHVRVNHAGTVAAVTRGDHVDLFRVADGAHLTIRPTASADPNEGVLLHVDEGMFAGSRTAFNQLRVRDQAAPFETRAFRADEASALQRATLGRDFVAGCPVTPAR